MYDIKIEEVFNGYIVTIGCQRFVFGGGTSMAASRVELVTALTAYLADREGTETAWRKRFGREGLPPGGHTHPVPDAHRHDHNPRPVPLAAGHHHDLQFVEAVEA